MNVVEQGCRYGCPSPTSTPEELERRAIIQSNDLILHEAVIKNDAETVKKILREPVDINCRNNYGRAPLHWASSRGNIEIMEMLIAASCDIEARDKYGMRPLLMASCHGHCDAVQLLINTGACSNATNKKGSTPLHVACHLDSRGILELLLQHGALLNKQNKTGNTPLHLACQTNVIGTAEILISKGAELNCINSRLQSPIHIAAEMGHTEICKLLLASGANIEQREVRGRTPLYIAARGSFTAIVDMIIRTARLDYPTHGDHTRKYTDLKPVLNTTRRKWKTGKVNGRGKDSERLREILYKLAYKQLKPGEWKRLAHHWAFTEEQIRAVEHQYTGLSSYKEHGFRVMLIWAHGLQLEVNPIRELYESLSAIGKRNVADTLRRKIDQENEERRKGRKQNCGQCSIT